MRSILPTQKKQRLDNYSHISRVYEIESSFAVVHRAFAHSVQRWADVVGRCIVMNVAIRKRLPRTCNASSLVRAEQIAETVQRKSKPSEQREFSFSDKRFMESENNHLSLSNAFHINISWEEVTWMKWQCYVNSTLDFKSQNYNFLR